MRSKKNTWAGVFVVAAMGSVDAALAGPTVSVTFVNLGVEKAAYQVVTSSEASTRVNANPMPAETVRPHERVVFSVKNGMTPDANAAVLRYTMGSKTCIFGTTFMNQISKGGLFTGRPLKAPQWKKTAEASGGAVCTATITAQSYSDYSWAVEFTMR